MAKDNQKQAKDETPTPLELCEAVGGDAILLCEALVAACNTDRFRRNNELQNLARGYQVSQIAIRELQDRLDQRQSDKDAAKEGGVLKSSASDSASKSGKGAKADPEDAE